MRGDSMSGIRIRRAILPRYAHGVANTCLSSPGNFPGRNGVWDCRHLVAIISSRFGSYQREERADRRVGPVPLVLISHR